MRAFDLLAWEVVRINLFLTELFLSLIAPLIKDSRNSYRVQQYLLSMSVLKTMSMDDIPPGPRAKMLNQGKFVIGVIVILIIMRAVH